MDQRLKWITSYERLTYVVDDQGGATDIFVEITVGPDFHAKLLKQISLSFSMPSLFCRLFLLSSLYTSRIVARCFDSDEFSAIPPNVEPESVNKEALLLRHILRKEEESRRRERERERETMASRIGSGNLSRVTELNLDSYYHKKDSRA